MIAYRTKIFTGFGLPEPGPSRAVLRHQNSTAPTPGLAALLLCASYAEECIVREFRFAAATSLFVLSAGANAAVTSKWTLASDYDFRDITQSALDPAVQASVDYVHDGGWYAGAWASNIDFCASGSSGCLDADHEVDLYTGFSGGTGEQGLGWDVGLIYYTYDESDYSYPEVYASLSKGWFKGKIWYSNDFGGDMTAGDTPAYYLEANATVSFAKDFTALSRGLQRRRLLERVRSRWQRPRVRRLFGGRGLLSGQVQSRTEMGRWQRLEGIGQHAGGRFSSEARVVLTVATTFPW